MATAIHHGPPGSFKSFTLVQRRAIDALKEGRVVVTNIRGFTSLDRIKDQFEDIHFPDTAELIYMHTEIAEHRLYMASWFHWVPLRALVLIDEAQRIYPDRRDFKKESLDTRIAPPGFEVQELAVEIEDEYTGERYFVYRPENVDTAFDMQRHFQWDVYLSTPNINKIKDFIREVAEVAYRHKSLSGKLPDWLAKLLGLHNAWYEFQHDAENNGKAATHLVGAPRKYKADERIFKCYQSTATGEHTQSKAGQSVFGDPKLKMVLAVLVLALGSLLWSALFGGKPAASKTDPASATLVPGPPANPGGTGLAKAAGPAAAGAVPDVLNQQSPGFFNQLGYKLLQIAYQDFADHYHNRLAFVADSEDGLKTVDFRQLAFDGVRVAIASVCSITLLAPDGTQLKLGCSAPQVKNCAVASDSETLIIRRNCHKYGELPKTPPNELREIELRPALMNMASADPAQPVPPGKAK
ncbi:hypothetical protein NP603_20335 [Methylomonas sp. SURF-1]|uniref:Zona occludens toxin N-terminal domain-containing protein n=1 Tax=Methylomonas aurea TaxID=2952224 RepID=A0ABT1UMK6_9GAMM|nr:zonular occludens toxin domain-containing protein [Methylomonas sp. SURF-1]MCQ8183472.1 hypothetical protein [Methylomonas sp. SURF-1]